MSKWMTMTEMARHFKTSRFQLNYVLESRGIEATRRVGLTRLFDDKAVKKIAAALETVGPNGPRSPMAAAAQA